MNRESIGEREERTMTTEEILQAGLDMLGKNGEHWVGRMPKFSRGECCALTAICNQQISLAARIEAYELLEKAGKIPRAEIPRWNDAPDRTWADVELAFKGAIELARAR